MADQDSVLPEIQVKVGETFEASMYCQSGTGYGWYVAGMPPGVALLGSASAPVPPAAPGGSVRTMFTFVASTAAAGETGTLIFQLLRPWDPTNPADQRVYTIKVLPAGGASLSDELKSIGGKGRFVAQPPFRSHLPPVVVEYGVFSEAASRANAGAVPDAFVIKPYGFPPLGMPPYGYPPAGYPRSSSEAHSVVESAENCVVKYGFPHGVANEEALCIFKYGYPVHPLYGVLPPGVTLEKAEPGSEQCRAMYGMITAEGEARVSADPSQCLLKYGAPKAAS
jgi:hypothetical protein